MAPQLKALITADVLAIFCISQGDNVCNVDRLWFLVVWNYILTILIPLPLSLVTVEYKYLLKSIISPNKIIENLFRQVQFACKFVSVHKFVVNDAMNRKHH